MPYKVYLVELGNCINDKGVSSQIAAKLKGYFDTVVQQYDAKYVGKGTPLGSSDVTWITSMPTVGTTELLVYFVGNSSNSVVKHMAGFGKTGSSDGLTNPDSGTPVGSEAYTSAANSSNTKGAALAALAFHECMHNKLRWGDTRLHGLNATTPAGGTGLSNSPIDPSFKLTPLEADTMAKHLLDLVAQWTDGINAWNDPLNGHL